MIDLFAKSPTVFFSVYELSLKNFGPNLRVYVISSRVSKRYLE